MTRTDISFLGGREEGQNLSKGRRQGHTKHTTERGNFIESQ